ncbi:hypothetical protein V6N13_107328 [Hibiscus sabdariffa]
MQKDINHKSNPSSSSSICIKNNQPKVSLFSSEFFTGILSVEYSPRRSFGVPSTSALRHTWIKVLLPSARYYSLFKGQAPDAAGKGKYALIKDEENFQTGIFDKPLPCFGCGIGWFSFLVGFLCPLMWYYATFLYFGNHYRKDPRERAGLAASAIAAMACSVLLLVIIIVSLLF